MPTPTYDATTRTCKDVVTGFSYRFLTGVAYSSANLQTKVLYASVCFKYGNFTWDDPNDLTTPQNFPLTFGAAFVPKAPVGKVLAQKPEPPLFEPLPEDIFYPFVKASQS